MSVSESYLSESKNSSSVQNDDNLDDLESNYQFFRNLVKRNIFQMTNINGKESI